MSFRQGATRLEIVVTIVIGASFLWLDRVGGDAVADADFELVLYREGYGSTNFSQRIAVVAAQKAIANQMFAEGLSWRDVPDEENPVTMKFGFSYCIETGVCLNCRVPDVAYRALLVEYMLEEQPAKNRLIPFEIPIPKQRVVELTIPREPPNDAEAWKPQ